MITVNGRPATVESDLRHGRLSCPDCPGILGPWGRARPRRIRTGLGDLETTVFHPLRAQCQGCQVTHVLLPVTLAARRADAAAVIAWALEAKTTRGAGHRSIARELGRPLSTVRGWLRSVTRCAQELIDRFTSLVLRDAADAAGLWPGDAPTALGRALAVVMAYARVLGERFELPAPAGLPWQVAALLAVGPWVFSGRRGSGNGATPIDPDAPEADG